MYYELPGYGKLVPNGNRGISGNRYAWDNTPPPEGEYRTVNDPIDVDFSEYSEKSRNNNWISHLEPPNLKGILSSSVNTVGKSDVAKEFLIAKNRAHIRIYHICPALEEAIKLDQFFDMYGYATNSVKIPNEDSRESWNYVKTNNVIINGSMPAQDMARIKAMYNRGVRFWHTTDVGNYSLSNRDKKEVTTNDSD